MFVKKRSQHFNGCVIGQSFFRTGWGKGVGVIFLFLFLCSSPSLGGRGPKGMAGEEDGSMTGRSIPPVTFMNYEEKVEALLHRLSQRQKLLPQEKERLKLVVAFERETPGVEPEMLTYLQRTNLPLLQSLIQK